MSTPTDPRTLTVADPASTDTASTDTGRARRHAGWGTTVGAVLAVVVAAGAVGRFVSLDRTDPGPSRAGAAAAAGSPAGSRAGTPTDAIAALEARVDTRPADAPAWQALAAAYVGRAATTGDPAWYAPARLAVERTTALAPDDPRTQVATAVVALAVHDFAAAADAAERAVALDPFDADALAAAVDAAVELGDLTRAETRLQTLLDLRPGGPALARASYLQELHGDLISARRTMASAEAATAAPDERAALAGYAGDLALAEGDLTAARAAYDRAVTLAPDHAGAQLGLARVAAARGDVAGARSRVDTLVARTPLPAAAALAADLATLADDASAARAARALVAANTALATSAGVRVDLEAALDAADHGDPDAAVALARRAYAERRTVFTADALAWALTRAGRAVEAAPLATEAVRLGTASASLRVHAAVTFAAADRPAEAAEELRAAFTLAPWPALSLRPEAARLADSLGVPVPDPWRS